jgi:dihydrolipoamide dehydrogenase
MRRTAIIGAGPGGYVAAITCARLGMETDLYEPFALGGECTNHGCIPTKTYYHYAKLINEISASQKRGIMSATQDFDFTKVHARKDQVITRLRAGINYLIKQGNIKLIPKKAEVISPRDVRTQPDQYVETYDNIIIATGSDPDIPPINGISGITPWTNRQALTTRAVPKRLLIIGGGVIGVEFAHIFSSFGASVTLVECLPSLIAGSDTMLSEMVLKALLKSGV